MKKFSFRLQTVLEMREKKLEDERKEMAVIVQRLNEQIGALEKIQARQNNIRKNIDFLYSEDKPLDIMEVVNYKDFLGKLLIDEQKQNLVVEQFRKILAVKQREVTEALKQVKILEKLKETKQEKFYKEIAYQEAKELDDIASTRYARQARA